jgi:hypothetical protein
MPIIPATQEVEIEGLWFEVNPGKKVSEILSQKKKKIQALY